MSDFETSTVNQIKPEPRQRVKYPMGMVLGPDDFEQEQFYLMERDRLHNRVLHGYGTVCGLKVTASTDSSSGEPVIMVSCGLAVNPQGRTIRVPEDQCARLNAWLNNHRDEVWQHLGSPPSAGPFSLTLHVVLDYSECETGMVPVPGGPCRSMEESMAASRIADDFILSLSLKPPDQMEEEWVRCFGKLLQQIEVASTAPEFQTRQKMEERVRKIVQALQGSLPACPFPEPPSSPGGSTTLYLKPAEADEILRAMFRVWVNEVRPRLFPRNKKCASLLAEESRVLLACLDFQVDEIDGKLQAVGSPPDISVLTDNAPVLLHTRLLQEWLLYSRLAQTSPAAATAHSSLRDNYVTVSAGRCMFETRPVNEIGDRDGVRRGTQLNVEEPAFGGLSVVRYNSTNRRAFLKFEDYSITKNYIVKITPILLKPKAIQPIAFMKNHRDGILLLIAPPDAPMPDGFMVEISQVLATR
jgi:hypothetical protein